jgi:Mg2+ and Co2+ transporter CorA
MDVSVITVAGLERHPVNELKDSWTLIHIVVWVDVPLCPVQGAEPLTDIFGFHDLVVQDCMEHNHVSTIHTYDDQVFTVTADRTCLRSTTDASETARVCLCAGAQPWSRQQPIGQYVVHRVVDTPHG